MESLREEIKIENASLIKSHASERFICSYNQLEIPKSPSNAMEFLSRSWSPSTSDFLRIFSSNNLLLSSETNGLDDETPKSTDGTKTSTIKNDKIKDLVECYFIKIQSTIENSLSRDTISHYISWLRKPRKLKFLTYSRLNQNCSISKQQKQRQTPSSSHHHIPIHLIDKYEPQMDFKHPKTWLRSTRYSISTFIRSQKEKKKEEKRLQTAQIHAALSLTQLAAAIAGISNSLGKQEMSQFRQESPIASNQDMGNVLSSAAALVTNVCAEAAEALGAHRAQVRAVVDSGVAIQTPLDMVAVTATAATCLRGAALLKSRTLTEPLSRIQEMLKISAEICIIMPSGRKEWTRVSVYFKHYRLMFCFRKKYFGGALTYPKEYQVTNITEERMDRQGNSYLLCLKTKNGVIKLVFEDEMQSKIWVSTIINLLEMKKPLLAKNQSYSPPFSLLSPTM